MAEEPVVTGPLSERLVHSSWKVRVAAYEELEKIFNEALDDNDPKFSEYGTYWKKIVGDNIAAAQDKGLDVLLVFLDRAKEASKHANTVCPLLVEKGLNAKEKTKVKAMEALYRFVEIESSEAVVSSLLKGGSHKNPKIVAASLTTIREIIRQFGPKAIDIKPIFNKLPAFFDHPDKNVRAEASSLTVELYKWLGSAIQTQTDKLRPAQIKDLNAAFEAVGDTKPTPTRFLRSQTSTGGILSQKTPQKEEEEEVDPFDLVEAADILSQLKNDWFENLKHTKWSIRKEQLDFLVSIADVPKIKSGDFSEVVKALKKCLSDSNINVSNSAAKCLGLLAKGLRSDFTFAKNVVPNLLEKFKDKKCISSAHDALNNIFDGCLDFPKIVEDVVNAAQHKTPSVRKETMVWVQKCLEKCVSPKKRGNMQEAIKPIGLLFIQLLDDTTADVRDNAASAFGTLIAMVGERQMQPYLNKLDKIKMKKVKDLTPQMDACATSSEAPDPNPKEPPAAPTSFSSFIKTTNPSQPPPKAKEVSSTKKEEKKAPTTIKRTASSRSNIPKKSASKKTSATSSTKQSNKQAGQSSASVASSIIPAEEALAKAQELIPGSILDQLNNSVWKQRLQGMEDLKAFVEKMDKTELNSNVEIIIRQLQHKPGWKESNFQVLNRAFELISHIANEITLSKGCISVVIPGLVEKIADVKLRSTVHNLLTLFVESHNSEFILNLLYKNAGDHKNPKVLAETVNWIGKMISEFGMASIQTKNLIDFLKKCLESSNPTVRNNTISTLGCIRRFVGPDLRNFLTDFKPSLLSLIDQEFDKISSEEPPAITRTFKGTNSSSSSSATASEGGLPRTDISSSLTSNLIKQLGDGNWKNRKEAIEQVNQIIVSASKRIQPNFGGLMPALKARLSDSNKKLVTMTLELLALLASSTGSAIEKHAKIILPSIINALGDNTKTIRESATQTLDVWVKEIGFEPFINHVPLSLESVGARKEVLTWVVKNLPKEKKDMDLNPLVKPTIACLEDKNVDVRKLAEQLLREIVDSVGLDTIRRQCSGLKQASKLVVTPIIESLRASDAPQPAKSSETFSKPKTSKPSAEKRGGNKARIETSRVGSTTTTTKAKSSPPPESKPLLLRNDQKEARAKKEKKIKTPTIEEPRKETVALLSEQMSLWTNETLCSKLFSSDFKKHIEAITEVCNYLEKNEYIEEMKDSLDLWLKWLSIRVYDTNMAILKKLLSFLKVLFTILEEQNYHFQDYEATIFLPCFIEKVLGSNNETIRQEMRGLLKLFVKLYPSSKLFKFLLEGLKSKNVRVRTECLDELGLLIERIGITVCQPNKSLPVIAEHIGERDTNARNAALSTLVKAYSYVGEDLWKKYVPNIQESYKEAFQEKLRFTNQDLKSPKAANTPLSKTRSFSSPISSPQTPVSDVSPETTSSPIAISQRDSFGPSVSSPVVPTFSLDVDDPDLEAIKSNDLEKATETLKSMCLPDNNTILTMDTSQLLSALAMKLQTACSTNPFPSRLFKYTLNTVYKVMSKASLARCVSKESLQAITLQILDTLLNPKIKETENGEASVKALSVVILHILKNADQTLLFEIFLKNLRDLSFSSNNKKLENVMKCLLSLTKSLQSSIGEVKVDRVLNEIYQFLEMHPPRKWKGKDDYPLRAIKTLLSELVGLLGENIRKYLSFLPPPKQECALVLYIDLMLKSSSSSSSSSSSYPPHSLSTSSSSSSSIQQPVVDPTSKLTEIFRKIGNNGEEGILELHKFRKSYPSFDINSYIQRTTKSTQDYIFSGLKKLEQNENEDPNPLKTSSAAAAMDRLRKLQKQIGSKPASPSSSFNYTTSQPKYSSFEAIRQKVNALSASGDGVPTTISNSGSLELVDEELNYVSQERDSWSSSSATSSSSSHTVDELKSKLARLKYQNSSMSS